MSSALELPESRVSRIEMVEDVAVIHFPHAYIRKSKGKPGRGAGKGWSQEAKLLLWNARVSKKPTLPNTIAGGFLEVGGIRHEMIPLPFKRKAGARLYLQFVDDSEIEVAGETPVIELLGKPIFVEDF